MPRMNLNLDVHLRDCEIGDIANTYEVVYIQLIQCRLSAI